MIVANFFHIKQSNGLLHYGLDYVTDLGDAVRHVITRPSLQPLVADRLPGIEVIACTAFRLPILMAQAAHAQDFVFTPTPHPFPWMSRQLVILHDAYPFSGSTRADLKRRLLRASLSSSRCRAGYINQSDALPFLMHLGLEPSRLVFAPNRFPQVDPGARPPTHPPANHLVIGLFGTDSTKKNYASLFAEVMRTGLAGRCLFRAYGHQTPYLDALRMAWPQIDIELFDSDRSALGSFLHGVDVVVSVARQEGFGRPIASALGLGVPCYLLSTSVFKEFFDPGATFFDDEPSLVNGLAAALHEGSLVAPAYAPPRRLLDAYAGAIESIRRNGHFR